MITSKISLSKLTSEMCRNHKISLRNKTKNRCGQQGWEEEVKKTCGKGCGYQGELLK